MEKKALNEESAGTDIWTLVYIYCPRKKTDIFIENSKSTDNKIES